MRAAFAASKAMHTACACVLAPCAVSHASHVALHQLQQMYTCLQNGSLAKREQELSKWQADLERREQQLGSGSGRSNVDDVKNFPPCCGIAHHDISKDVPHGKRSITRMCAPPLRPFLACTALASAACLPCRCSCCVLVRGQCVGFPVTGASGLHR